MVDYGSCTIISTVFVHHLLSEKKLKPKYFFISQEFCPLVITISISTTDNSLSSEAFFNPFPCHIGEWLRNDNNTSFYKPACDVLFPLACVRALYSTLHVESCCSATKDNKTTSRVKCGSKCIARLY